MSIFERLFAKRRAPASTAARERPEAAAPAAERSPGITLPQAIQLAVEHHNASRLQEAANIYTQVLAADDRNFDALHLLGVLYHQQGEHQRAAEKIEKALGVDASSASAHSNLGECYRAMNRNREARECYEKALALQPTWAPAAYNLGNLLRREEKFAEARAYYEKALSAQPGMVDARYQLGNTFEAQGKLDSAKACFEQVLAAQPQHKACHFSLGGVMIALGNVANAESCYRKALELDRGFVPAMINLANVLAEQARFAEAKSYYENATSLAQNSFEAYLGLGNMCRNLHLEVQARASYEKALVLEPDSVPALLGLGNALVDQGEQQAALQMYKKALSIDPENARLRWLYTVAQLPAIYPTMESVKQARAEFISELEALEAWFDAERSKRGHEVVGALQPFLLAYQDESNGELLARYGALSARLMRVWQESRPRMPIVSQERKIGDKIRLGIVSAHVSDHSVWNAIVRGFVSHLDRTKIDVQVFYLGNHVDHETNFAKSRSSHFEHGSKSWQQWADSIAKQHPDILIYPEIGMDAATARLASLRLAPVQAASWGHPETTGLPTVDYYLSAEYLEPPGAQNHYTEKLVALPNLGCFVESSEGVAASPNLSAMMEVDTSVPLFLCPGVPFKYVPENDQVLVDIARRVKQCQFIFFTHRLANLSARLRERLEALFISAGLNPKKFIVFVPWQNKAAFYGLMKRADVFLDTIGFSGFNTALQGVECSLPIVTREGRFMRGRLASGILNQMGLQELVAHSNNEYVEVAVRLATDQARRTKVREQIEANKHKLFNDLMPVRALEEFIATAVREH